MLKNWEYTKSGEKNKNGKEQLLLDTERPHRMNDTPQLQTNFVRQGSFKATFFMVETPSYGNVWLSLGWSTIRMASVISIFEPRYHGLSHLNDH